MRLYIPLLCLSFANLAFGKHICSASRVLNAPEEISGLASSVGEIGSEINSSDFETKVKLVCNEMYDSTKLTNNPAKKLEKAILRIMGEGETITNKEKFVSDLVSSNKIYCNSAANYKIRDNEPFLKRSVSSGNAHFIMYLGDNDKYDIDFNAVEMIDGEEETILDYLDKILEDPNLSSMYEEDDIEDLIEIIEENGGIRKRNG